jgi:dipeptide/tripeptide permease
MLGAEIDLMSFMTLRYFGTRAYGIIFALMFGTYTLISIVGPVAGGMLIETRGYDAIYQVAAVAWGAATLAFVLLSRMSDEKPLMPDATGH